MQDDFFVVVFLNLTPFSSRAASGLLMLLTNLLTCSKCLVISVASTISMIACRNVRYSFLERERERERERGGQESDGWRQDRGEEGPEEPERVRDDSVVNSMKPRVNSFSLLTAVTAAMNGCFVHPLPLWGDQHMWAILLWDSNHITTPPLSTHTQCRFHQQAQLIGCDASGNVWCEQFFF